MDFIDVMKKRRMVRNFTNEPVAPEVIERLFDIAQRAPSAGFTQGQSFIVVTNPEHKIEIGKLCEEEAYAHPFVSRAPVLAIACTSEAAYHRRYQEADKTNDDGTEIEWPIPYWHMDIGCSIMALLLAVVNEGLAAGFAGVTNDKNYARLHQLLNIPDEITPVGVIPIGHPAQDVRSGSLKRGRKPDFLHHETW